MDVSFLSSTAGAFDRKTQIAFTRGDDIIIVEYVGNEVPALLQFATQRSLEAAENSTLTFHSRPNIIRNAFDQSWIKGWIADDFRSRPSEYRSEWKHFCEASLGRNIDVRVAGLAEDMAHLLEIALGKRAGPPRSKPGDPFEDPWAKP